VRDYFGDKFNQRYTEALEPYKNMNVETQPILNNIDQPVDRLAPNGVDDQSALSPKVKKFLGDTREKLEGPDYAEQVARARQQWGSSNQFSRAVAKLQPDPTDINQLRDIQSSIRAMSRGSTTPTDKRLLAQLEDSISGAIDKTMTDAGAAPEDLTKLRQIDSDYRQYSAQCLSQ
jgi:hypothetical protein